MLNFKESKQKYQKFLKVWILECFIIALLIYVVNELGYDFARSIDNALYGEAIGPNTNPNYLYLSTALDDAIPVVKVFIVPYLLTYPFWLLGPFLIYGFMGRKAFYQFATAAITFGICSFIIFVIAPNAIKPDFRPSNIDPNSKNILDQLLNICYSSDTLNNAFPSGHWGFTLMVAVGMRSAIFDKRSNYLRRLTAIGFYIYAIIICLSTLFVKQHYIFDGVAAVILVELLWFIFHHVKLPEYVERMMYRWNAKLGIVNDPKIKKYQNKTKIWNWVLWSFIAVLMLIGLWYTNFILLQLTSTLSFFTIWFIGISCYYLIPSQRSKTFIDYNEFY